VKAMVDILAAILIIVFGLIVIFLAFSIIFAVIWALADSYLFEQLATICLVTTVILFAVALLLLVVLGVASLVTFSKGA
jgi:hypothetical protein